MNNITKEERMKCGAAKLDALIKNASPGEFICQVTSESIVRKYNNVDVTPAIYTGSLPPQDRIPMFNVTKKVL